MANSLFLRQQNKVTRESTQNLIRSILDPGQRESVEIDMASAKMAMKVAVANAVLGRSHVLGNILFGKPVLGR